MPVYSSVTAGFIAPAVSQLTDAATIAVDASLGNDFRVTLGGSRTMGAPSNPSDGQTIVFCLEQDATGGRTITWNTIYDFGTAGAPSLSTSPGAVDIVGFKYHAGLAKWCGLGSSLGF